jgi:hypothetical protein
MAAKHLALVLLGGKVQSEILRCPALSRNSMNYSFPLGKLGRAEQEAFYMLFLRPQNVLGTVAP